MNSIHKVALAVVAATSLGCGAVDEDVENVGSEEHALIFNQHSRDLGVFHAADSSWWFDTNDNGAWDGAPPDEYMVNNFGGGDKVVLSGFGVNGDQSQNCGSNGGMIGTWSPSTRKFFLDANNNRVWDGQLTDILVHNFMPAQAGFTDQPIIWTRSWVDIQFVKCFGVIGYYRRPNAGGGSATWYIDYNNNRVWDGPAVDRQYSWGGQGQIAVPLLGFQGSKLATFEPATGIWYVDENKDFGWQGCGLGDTCQVFGGPSSKPFSHPNGVWRAVSDGTIRYVDLNNSGVWDAGDQWYNYGQASSQAFFF
jgi:hypothetical protein